MKKISLLAVVLASGSAMADVSVGGFVDTQFSWGSSTASKTNTFHLNDAAIYLNGSLGEYSAMVDIPFSADSTGASNTFTLGGTKAQAYVAGKYANGFHWNLGQFDALVGSEGKDTVDNPFTTLSDITKSFPMTHMGARLGYMITADWDFDVLVADPYNKSYKFKDNNDATDDVMFDFGVRLKGKMPDMSISEFTGTFLMSNTGTVKPWLFSGILGLDFGELHMRGDGFLRNTGLTGSDTIMGIGGYTLYDISSTASYGLRFTYVGKEPAAYGNNKYTLTTGPQFKLTKQFTAKVDYTLANSVADVKSHAINLAGVYRF